MTKGRLNQGHYFTRGTQIKRSTALQSKALIMQRNGKQKIPANTRDRREITEKQERIIPFLLCEPSVEAAAKSARVDAGTVWRWMKQPEFQQAYREARREAVRQAVARLQQVCGAAVESLRDVMTNDNNAASARVSAAKSILEFSLRAIEIDDLESRVGRLEEKEKEKKR
jgi:hypothetical protein